MERIVLSPLPVTLEREKLMELNHIPADSDLAEDFADVVEAAGRVLRCKTILVKADGPVSFPLPPGIEPKYYYAMTVGREIDEDEDCDYPYRGTWCARPPWTGPWPIPRTISAIGWG